MDEGAVICCQGLVWVRTLAAEFWTHWSLSRVLLCAPIRNPMQYLRRTRCTGPS